MTQRVRFVVRPVLWLGVLGVLSAGVAPPAIDAAAPPLHAARPPAPRFKLKDVTGKTLDLDVLRRRGPVVLDFWATWCKPCIASLPELERIHRKYQAMGLTVIGVSVDGPRNHSKVRPFALKLGLTFPIAIDNDERLRHLYQVVAMPTTILVDTAGTVANVTLGYRPGEGADLERRIEALFAGADTDATPPGGATADSSHGDVVKP